MDDLTWKRMTTAFPRVLKGARVQTEPLAAAKAKQPPLLAGAFSPDEKRIALSGGGRIPGRPVIWVASVPSLETVATLHGHQGVHDLAWHSETGLLASASNDYTVVLWDIDRADHLFVIGGDQEPIVKGSVAFSKAALFVGETEAFRGLRARLLRVSLDDGRVTTVCQLGPNQSVASLAVEAASDRWVFAEADFDQYSNPPTLVSGVKAERQGTGTAISSTLLALGWYEGAPASVLVGKPGTELWRAGSSLPLAITDPTCARFSSDGHVVAIATKASVALVDTGDGRVIADFDLPPAGQGQGATMLAWSPSGAMLCVAGFGFVALVDAQKAALLHTMTPPAWWMGTGRQ